MAHRIGTFYGQTSDDWREINAAQDIDTYFVSSGFDDMWIDLTTP
jgi:hypothetical protein